jgi:uncharacterized protein (AIM24 family)
VELITGLQRSLGAGVFGGEGFLLLRLSGNCTAWVELGGEIITHVLEPGETLLVNPGHVGMLEESVRSTSPPSAASRTRCSVVTGSSWCN